MKLQDHVKRHIITLGLLLLATWFRLWQLQAIPPGFWDDEAYNAMDAVWMLQTNSWPLFLPGNFGREVLYHYLLAGAITLFGGSVISIRLVSVFASVLAVALMVRWGRVLFKGQPYASGLALVAAAGLATSFTYLVMNRVGYRVNVLLPLLLLTNICYWRGWQTSRYRYYLLAGLFLGLAQYTYLSARLLPLIFALFVLLQSIFLRNDRIRLKRGWIGLLLMAGVSALVVSPLVWYFANNPAIFLGRADEVAVTNIGSRSGLMAHVGTALSVFVGGGEITNWRHHLIGQPMFDWFTTLTFWIGLLVALRYARRAPYLFVLLSLLVMWLPAPLSTPAIHTLRLAGMLPAYYVLVAIGLIHTLVWLQRRFSLAIPRQRLYYIALALIVLISGLLTGYNYFLRWGTAREVYVAFNGPVVDLATALLHPATPSEQMVIPSYFYGQEAVRYILNDKYAEQPVVSEAALADLNNNDTPAVFVMPSLPHDGSPQALIWLSANQTAGGTAYLSAIQPYLNLTDLQTEPARPVMGSRKEAVGQTHPLDMAVVAPIFPRQLPEQRISYQWGETLQLRGYSFEPALLAPGQISFLSLTWQVVNCPSFQEVDALKARMFIQIIDQTANGLGQQELQPVASGMLNWRSGCRFSQQIPLNLGSNPEAGLYFVRLGFFDDKSQQRLPVLNQAQQPLGDAVNLGPLYVASETANPQQPAKAVTARLGDTIELTGFTLSTADEANSSQVRLFWKTLRPPQKNYTAFIQLLDAQNNVIAQYDAQPLAQVYPPAQWQAGDMLSEPFILPVAPALLRPPNKLITGMYELESGVRLPAYGPDGQPLPDAVIQLLP